LANFRLFWKNCWQELKEILPSALFFYQNWKNSLNLEYWENFLAEMLAECIWREFLPFFRYLERTLPNFVNPEKAQISSNEKVVFGSFGSLVGISPQHFDSLLGLFETYISCVL
jgi:hypothetical protein